MITLVHAGEITKSKIDTLRPGFRDKVNKWMDEVLLAGIIPYIYEGYRSNERQDELYALGRTTPGRVVTNAQAGQSFHNHSLAIDWVALRLVEKAADMWEADWNNEVAYGVGREIADKHGLRYLSWESPHLESNQYPTWRDIPKE